MRRSTLAGVLAMACFLRADSAGSGILTGRMAGFPRVMLWAWERPEDLRFIDPQEVGVAFLARTLTLRGGEVGVRPRLQPLQIPPGTRLIAVARIETDHAVRPEHSAEQKEQLVAALAELPRLPGVGAVQVDYDALASERGFYRSVLTELHRRLPDSIGLSITALASWCLGDHWLNGLPIDEAVPMLFRMGVDDHSVRQALDSGEDFSASACRGSVGISTDEPWPSWPTARRVYLFGTQGWTPARAAIVFRGVKSKG